MTDVIIDRGVVVAREGANIRIKVEAGEACESCGARILCSPGGENSRTIVAYNAIDAQVGDKVEVAEEGNLLLKMSAFQYGIPLLGFLCGIGISYVLSDSENNELILFLSGLIGLAVGAGLSWLGVRRLARRPAQLLIATRLVN